MTARDIEMLSDRRGAKYVRPSLAQENESTQTIVSEICGPHSSIIYVMARRMA
jgi:hypothetical protein